MEDKSVKKAIALKYDHHDSAPNVVAIGKGLVAKRIIENARESGIPLVQEPEVAQELSQLYLGSPVPPRLYQAIAEIYAFLIGIDKDLERK